MSFSKLVFLLCLGGGINIISGPALGSILTRTDFVESVPTVSAPILSATSPLTIDLVNIMSDSYVYEGNAYSTILPNNALPFWFEGKDNAETIIEERTGQRNMNAVQRLPFSLLVVNDTPFESPITKDADGQAFGRFQCFFYPTVIARPGALEGYEFFLERPLLPGESLRSPPSTEEITECQEKYKSAYIRLPIGLYSPQEVTFMENQEAVSAYLSKSLSILSRKEKIEDLCIEDIESLIERRDVRIEDRIESHSIAAWYYYNSGDYQLSYEHTESVLKSDASTFFAKAVSKQMLANFSRRGQGCETDFERAWTLYHEVLEDSFSLPDNKAFAQFYLAKMLFKAQGRDINLEEALRFCNEALDYLTGKEEHREILHKAVVLKEKINNPGFYVRAYIFGQDLKKWSPFVWLPTVY